MWQLFFLVIYIVHGSTVTSNVTRTNMNFDSSEQCISAGNQAIAAHLGQFVVAPICIPYKDALKKDDSND